MTNITDEIVSADEALQAAETRVSEASRILRQYRREHRTAREELSRLIKELRTGESRYPLLERIAAGTAACLRSYLVYGPMPEHGLRSLLGHVNVPGGDSPDVYLPMAIIKSDFQVAPLSEPLPSGETLGWYPCGDPSPAEPVASAPAPGTSPVAKRNRKAR